MTTTVHLGAHTDAPNHYGANSESIESRSLNYYIGPCQVIQISIPRAQRIRLSDIQNVEIKAPRILFKTLSYPDPYQWNDDFNSLSAELIQYLFSSGVQLVGIDTPSIDPATDKTLESHLCVHENNMAILEGIVLDHVAVGVYELIALPLKIEGADATPVRAILRTIKEI